MRTRRWSPLVGAGLIAVQFGLLVFGEAQNLGANPNAAGIDQLPGYFARQGPYMSAAAYRTHLGFFILAMIGGLIALPRARTVDIQSSPELRPVDTPFR